MGLVHIKKVEKVNYGNQQRLGSIMFKKLKRWWKVKKLNKALLKQAKLDKDLPPYGYERVSDWLEKNEFNLRLKDLQGHCMSQVPRTRTKSIDKKINA